MRRVDRRIDDHVPQGMRQRCACLAADQPALPQEARAGCRDQLDRQKAQAGARVDVVGGIGKVIEHRAASLTCYCRQGGLRPAHERDWPSPARPKFAAEKEREKFSDRLTSRRLPRTARPDLAVAAALPSSGRSGEPTP